MKEDKKVPQLRFPEFTDAWKQRELGEIAERVTRRNSSLESQTPLTISAEYGLIDQNKFFGKRIAAKDLSNYYLIQKGEFAYNKSTSNDAPWGAIKRLDCYNNGALSTLYIVFKIKDNKSCYSDFLVTYYGTSLWHKEVKEIASEGARNHGLLNVSPSDFFRTKLVIPQDFEEQRKIGAFFTQLDNTITLQQRKLNSLQKLKKGLLQKMFPKNGENIPEIRFPEFSDAWKQCKLSDLVNVIDGDRGKNYPTEADFEPHGHTLFLNASNVTIDGFLFDTNQFITEEKSNSMGSGKIIKDDIIITSRGSLGHIAWYNDSVQQVMPHLRINSGMLILRNKANVKTSYLHQFMKSDKGKAQIVFMSFGSAQPQLTKKGVESFTVNYPIDTEEQIKIGAFFSKLDNTITLQQRKLESLQKLKKGLLQQMFI